MRIAAAATTALVPSKQQAEPADEQDFPQQMSALMTRKSAAKSVSMYKEHAPALNMAREHAHARRLDDDSSVNKRAVEAYLENETQTLQPEYELLLRLDVFV